MVLKPANSDTENRIKNSKMSPIINSGNWKLEKTLFERYHNYTAIKLKQFVYSFSFQNVPLIEFFFL